MGKSKKFKLNFRDIIKGLVVTVISGVITTAYQGLQTGTPMDINQIGVSAGAAGVGYICKNFFEGK
jgi:hypothetical protein